MFHCFSLFLHTTYDERRLNDRLTRGPGEQAGILADSLPDAIERLQQEQRAAVRAAADAESQVAVWLEAVHERLAGAAGAAREAEARQRAELAAAAEAAGAAREAGVSALGGELERLADAVGARLGALEEAQRGAAVRAHAGDGPGPPSRPPRFAP